jgi:hypothetical protein
MIISNSEEISMSKEIVAVVQAPFQNAFGMLERYMEVCPDDIWKEKSGGWPVWQQIYHALGVLDFFVRSEGEEPIPEPLDPGVVKLAQVSGDLLSRDDMRKLAGQHKARVEAYIARLTDADLARINPGLSARIGRELTHGAVLVMLSSHTLYHLGSCDAALRNHGLKGVF